MLALFADATTSDTTWVAVGLSAVAMIGGAVATVVAAFVSVSQNKTNTKTALLEVKLEVAEQKTKECEEKHDVTAAKLDRCEEKHESTELRVSQLEAIVKAKP